MGHPYRDNLPPKQHRWRECGFNYECTDCHGLWCWGTLAPREACDPDADLAQRAVAARVLK